MEEAGDPELVSQASPNGASLENLIACADGCLYQSKEGGRDRVTAATLGDAKGGK